MTSMDRLRHAIYWIIALGLGLPVGLVAILLVVGNLAPVQRWGATQIASLSGDTVRAQGLHGRFPDALRLDRLELADAKGTYATADNIALDWSPTALALWTLRIDTASVGHLAVLRPPVLEKTPSQAGGGAKRLPIRIDLRHLQIDRADIAAGLAGTAFAASLDGTADIISLDDGAAGVTITRLDSAGAYHMDAALHPSAANAHVSIQEPAGGLIATIGKLQFLGPISVNATIDGPKSAELARLDAKIGQLQARLTGSVDLPGKLLALDIAANAPAMQPRADIGWQNIDLNAHIAGSFTQPDATGHLTLHGLQAAGTGLADLQADLAGDQGSATLHAILTGLRIPGRTPDVFAASPFDLQANINLAAPDRPANFRLTHKLLTADGTARTANPVAAQIHLVLPDLAPLSAAAGADVKGHADLRANLASTGQAKNLAAAGTITIDGGATPPPGLRGDTRLNVAATLTGSDITLRQATLEGKNIRLNASGTAAQAAVALNFNANVANLSEFVLQSEGSLAAIGQITGPMQNLHVNARVQGTAGAPKYGKGPVDITLNADHLPAAPEADLHGSVFLAGANLVLAAHAATDERGTIVATIDHADWKSAKIRADLSTPKGGTPSGKLTIEAGNLADFDALTGQSLAGRLNAVLTTSETDATVQLDGSDLAAGANRIAALALSGRASGIQSDPDITATLTLAGIAAGQVIGSARLTANGRAAALQLRTDANLQNLQGAPASLTAAALLDSKSKQATLQSLNASWKDLALRLQDQSRLDFGQKIAVDRLRLALNQATIELAGQFGPSLDFTANIRNVTPDLAKSFVPELNATGTLVADARLAGPRAAPNGTIHLHATGLRAKSGPAASLSPASVKTIVTLAGGTASIDADIDAGPKLHLAATGAVPLQPKAALALHVLGHTDLALLNPVLQASGRQAKGTANLDLAVVGTPQSPRVTGAMTLADADIQDFAQGLHLDRINGRIDATGDALSFTRLTARAGPGTINLAGSIGIANPELPVDLRITARQARPLASDLITATFDADLAVKGPATGTMDATGTVKLRQMDILIPDSLPPSVAVLHVRRAGQKPVPAASGPTRPPSSVRLAIDVDAPSSIFVRGKGLDAEMAGALQIRGTSTTPNIEGGFTLRRGDFSLAGTTLKFSKGDVSFNGEGVNHTIDPTLDFEADSYSGNITATLAITGYADAPKISLSSVPDLPQDEMLAHLLFGQSMSQLSPLQIAEIGAALAEISGLTGGGEGPLGAVRRGLGLDRLSVGGGSGGAGTSVEAGRYVARGVYVGTKQSTSGAGGTQVQVQIDLTRHLKLNSTLGTGGGTTQGATPDNDPGSSLGLGYGFEY